MLLLLTLLLLLPASVSYAVSQHHPFVARDGGFVFVLVSAAEQLVQLQVLLGRLVT